MGRRQRKRTVQAFPSGEDRTGPVSAAFDTVTTPTWSAPLIIFLYTLVFFAIFPAVLWAFGERLDAVLALPTLAGAWQWFGLGLVVSGVPWLAWSMVALSRRGSGWPISHLPPRRLVTGGPYRRIRHPVYVAYTVVFAGAGFLTGSLGSGIGASALLCALWILYVLVFEEPGLRRRYGSAFDEYRLATSLLPLPASAALRNGLVILWRTSRPPVQWLANHTVLFRLGPSIWVTYGGFLALGAALTATGIFGLLGAAGVPAHLTARYVVGLAASMIIGGRVIWLAYHIGQCRADLWQSMRTVGFVSWGALVGMIGFALLSAGYMDLDPFWLIDRTMIPLMASVVFGRIGCLTYGCCYGRPSSEGIRWTSQTAKLVRKMGPAGAVPRVPTQLLSSLHAIVTVCVLLAVTFRPVPDGFVTGLTLLMYGLGRVGIDHFREERRHGRPQLTAGQIGGAGVALVGLALLLLVRNGSGWERPATAFDLGLALEMWYIPLAVAALVFVSGAFHWKRVGRW